MIKHCDKHGEYEAKELDLCGRVVYSMCPKCEAEEAELEQAEKRQKETARLERLLNVSGIPKLFERCTIDNYHVNCIDQENTLALCKSYIGMFPGCSDPLFLVGSYGTGKTHLAIAIMKRLLSMGHIKTGYYTTTMRMIRDIRGSYHHTSTETEQGIIDKYVDKDLLILDEIGVQNGTDNEKLLIYEVLNGRYENLRPTILISNYSVNEIKDYLSERVFDRLQGKNKLLAVFDWESERGKA
jgi:DNA replication protein DnaC